MSQFIAAHYLCGLRVVVPQRLANTIFPVQGIIVARTEYHDGPEPNYTVRYLNAAGMVTVVDINQSTLDDAQCDGEPSGGEVVEFKEPAADKKRAARK